MATVDELPDDLKPLGRRVPSTALVNMSQPELECRCAEAQQLLSEADSEPDESRARRKRREADKVLSAMSLSAYMAEQGRLLERIDQADKGSYEYRALLGELDQLARDNPIPWERLSGVLLEHAERQLQSAAKPRWFRKGKTNA